MKKNPKKTPRENTKLPKETLEERVHRHLNDINSVITEDDIRNVKTELNTEQETARQEQPPTKARKTRKSGKQKKENETDAAEKHTTPWDVLSEGYD